MQPWVSWTQNLLGAHGTLMWLTVALVATLASADDLHDLSHPSWRDLEASWNRLAVDARL